MRHPSGPPTRPTLPVYSPLRIFETPKSEESVEIVQTGAEGAIWPVFGS